MDFNETENNNLKKLQEGYKGTMPKPLKERSQKQTANSNLDNNNKQSQK